MHADLRSDHTLRLSPGSTSSMRPIIGSGPTGPTGATGIQGPPGPGTGAGAWVASTAYATNQVVQAPDGSIIYRISAGTSRPSFDATEKALWAAVSSKAGTIEQVYQSATLARRTDVTSVTNIDFTTKTNGAAPTSMDTGEAVTLAGSVPVISSGALVGSPSGVGAYADYFQWPLGANGNHAWAAWEVPAGVDNGFGSICLGLWDHNFVGSPPEARGHFSISTEGDVWMFYVISSGGVIVLVKQGTCDPTGDYRFVEFWIDDDTAYCILPDGNIATVTDAEQMAAQTVAGVGSPKTFAQMGGSVAFVEHFAATLASTTKLPRILGCGADVALPRPGLNADGLSATKRVLAMRDTILDNGEATTRYHHVTTVLTTVPTTQAAVDGTNVKVVTRYGPTGKVEVDVEAHLEFTGTDIVYWQLHDGTGLVSDYEMAWYGFNGENPVARRLIVAYGGTPGAAVTLTLRHASLAAGVKVVYGAGAPYSVPIIMRAKPA